MRLATEQDIIQARIRLLLREPFFGLLATRLKVVNASKWIPTCATDGRHLYFNEKFMGEQDRDGTLFIVAHEVLHCVYDHLDRRDGREPKLWNAAGDYAINLELIDCGFKMPMTSEGKPLGLLEEKYRGMTANEIYEQLLEDKKNGKLPEGLDSFDVHLCGDNNGGNGDDAENKDYDETGTTAPVRLSDEDRQEIENEIKQAIQQASKQVDPKSKGVPGRIRRYLDQLNDNKIHWADFVNKQVQSSIISDFQWTRPNRKVMSQGIILPSVKKDDAVSITIGIDTSGSINEEMFRNAISEVYGIMQQFGSFEINFFCWDACCYTLHTFTEENGDQLLDVEFEGGGGNNGIVFIEKFLEEHEADTSNVVLFTDGHILGPWDDGTPPEYADNTTFVLWESSNVEPPWGNFIKY